jgi:hypothetical protein
MSGGRKKPWKSKSGKPRRKGKMEGVATKRYNNTIFISKNVYTKIIVIYADVDGRRFEKEYRCNEKDAIDSFRNFVGSQLY